MPSRGSILWAMVLVSDNVVQSRKKETCMLTLFGISRHNLLYRVVLLFLSCAE